MIRLDPPELGRIEVSLNVDAKGNAQAALTADKPQNPRSSAAVIPARSNAH